MELCAGRILTKGVGAGNNDWEDRSSYSGGRRKEETYYQRQGFEWQAMIRKRTQHARGKECG